MAVRAILRHARLSPQKARLVADLVRGVSIDKALDTLTFSTKKAAGIIKEVVISAVANAENKGLDIDELKISKICVDQAPNFRRFKARAKGRSTRIIKRNCHITVEVASE